VGHCCYISQQKPFHTLSACRIVVDAERQDLRQRLARRQQERAELERHLHAVRRRYAEEVAPLEEEVLRRKVEHLRRTAQRHMQSAKHRNAYHDAQREYEAFREERSQAPSVAPDELKRRYRAAGKQCHPDVVASVYHEQAAATFRALDAAYQAGHGAAVRAIADSLDRWGFPTATADAVDDEETTRELRRAVSHLQSAIESIRATDAYQAVVEGGDVDAVLRARKEGLRRVLRELKTA